MSMASNIGEFKTHTTAIECVHRCLAIRFAGEVDLTAIVNLTMFLACL